MRYLLLGIILGIIISLFPVFNPATAIEILPEWHGNVQSIDHLQKSGNPLISGINLRPLLAQPNIYLLSGNGNLLRKVSLNDHLIALSNSGQYYIQYEKTGTYIELRNTKGDRFWRIQSREYPYLTFNAKIILLMNGDHSRIRIIDINGNETGSKEVQGRLCTVISFSDHSDYSGIGFLDGSYYILGEKGEIINNGTTPAGTLIKSIAISTNGRFFSVHYGNTKADFVKVVNISENVSFLFPLKNVHLTKTGMYLSDNGNLAVFNRDRIFVTDADEIKSIIKILPGKEGFSSVGLSNGVYSASYMGIDNRARFLMFLEDGQIIFSKAYEGESFIESVMYGNAVIVRGSGDLFCYSFRLPSI